MSKAFTKEDTEVEDDLPEEPAVALPAGAKNYITPAGFRRMQEELKHLQTAERPRIVEIVSWAAGNGDRSENGDYIYGKQRLREIDRRGRYLAKRIGSAAVVDPDQQENQDQGFFGATVAYARKDNKSSTVTIVAIAET